MCADGSRLPLGLLAHHVARIAGLEQECRIGLAATELLHAQRRTKALEVVRQIVVQAFDIEFVPRPRVRDVNACHADFLWNTKRKSGGPWKARRPLSLKVQFALQVTGGATSAALTVVLMTGRSVPSTGSTIPK